MRIYFTYVIITTIHPSNYETLICDKKYLSVLILDRENTLSFSVEHSVQLYKLLMTRWISLSLWV